MKFSHPQRDPEIQISSEERKFNWIFAVRDNGIGFSGHDGEAIFLFKTLSNHKEVGVGIGLATWRKVVELHGGQIWG